jgi:hypothetical protein
MAISVVSKHTYKPGPHDFYIGRGSALGNPFTHLRSHSTAKYWVLTRDEAIESYRPWIKEQIEQKAEGVNELLHEILLAVIAGHDVQLLCFCAPLSCHGDIVKDIIEHRYNIYLKNEKNK